jgi:ubiquinone biosynthesis protein COQ4
MPTRPPAPDRVRPIEAFRALGALFRDPDDTSQVFRVIRALSGRSGERGFQRFAHSEAGARILEQRSVLREKLENREQLLALPAGSLGRAYAAFMDREHLSAGGLVGASDESRREDSLLDPERALYTERLRDMHDLWHVVTGYERDLLGEAALLAFTYKQTRNRGIGFIVANVYLRAGDSEELRPMIRAAWKRGRAARWLPAEPWEALLEQPLESVREHLNVGPPPAYGQRRSDGAPALA